MCLAALWGGGSFLADGLFHSFLVLISGAFLTCGSGFRSMHQYLWSAYCAQDQRDLSLKAPVPVVFTARGWWVKLLEVCFFVRFSVFLHVFLVLFVVPEIKGQSPFVCVFTTPLIT